MSKKEHNQIHNEYKIDDWIIDIQTKEVYRIVNIWAFPARVHVKYLMSPNDTLPFEMIKYNDLVNYFKKIPKNLELVQILYKE